MRRSLLVGALAVAVVAVLAGCGGKAGTAERVSRGATMFEAGDYDGARAYFEGVLEKTPQSDEAAYYLGRVAIVQERHDAAVARLKYAVELAPENSDYYYWLGVAYANKLNDTQDFMEKGRLAPLMRDAVKKAVELNPDNLDAREFLAQYFFNAPPMVGGSVEEGEKEIGEITKRDPVRGHLFAARIYLMRMNRVKAEKEIVQAVELAPDDPDVRYQLGRFYQDTKDYIEAFAAFEEALKDDPDHRGALYQIGRTAVLSGVHLERGAECLQKYLTLDQEPGQPSMSHAHWRLGMIYEKQGHPDRARAEYEEALRLDPDNAKAKESLEALGGTE